MAPCKMIGNEIFSREKRRPNSAEFNLSKRWLDSESLHLRFRFQSSQLE